MKIVNSKGTETEDNFYCLEPNKSFPEAETKIYNNVGDLENLNIENKESILWLAKNICMQDASDETINSYIGNAFNEVILYAPLKKNFSAETSFGKQK